LRHAKVFIHGKNGLSKILIKKGELNEGGLIKRDGQGFALLSKGGRGSFGGKS
jgi:hypothetical protein